MKKTAEQLHLEAKQVMRLSIFDRGDKNFFSDLVNREMRRAMISRLIRIRQNYFFVACALFVLAFASTFIPQGSAAAMSWIIFVFSVVSYLDVQNRLRLLELADQLQPEEKALPT